MARVLVVDDDLGLLRVLRSVLSGAGHRVRTAATGGDALASFEEEAPEIVVLDLGLPDMDGLEVCRPVHQSSSVPILAMSGGGLADRGSAALDAGATGFIDKPFSASELIAAICSAFPV